MGALAVAVGALQLFLRALVIRLQQLEILLGSLAIGLGALQFFLCPLALAVRTLQIVVCRLAIGLRPLAVGVRSFEIRLCALEIRLRTVPFGTRLLEVRLRASALGRDGFVEFTPCLRRRVRCRLLGFTVRLRNRVSNRAIHLGAGGGDFRLKARIPLRVNGVELRRPPLVGVRVSTLTGFVQGLLVTLRQIAEVRVQLGLQFGADGVDDAAKLFLGH
ncbi:MAG: hypothetical protein ACJ731_11630 [Vicinamibacterales bacterium]